MKELVEGRLAIDTDGLDEEIRCEMCRNPMCNDRGCDGNCKYDEELYKKITQAIDKRVAPLPSVQPEITDEQAIEHLQESGWMQSHDKQMYEAGLKEKLADDSGSYDALLPPAQPDYIEVLGWLLAYHTKSFDLHGRYLPHEVISWLINDFTKGFIAERRRDERFN